MSVVDSKEFRDFVLYGRENIEEGDLPHRTQLIQMIFNTYAKEHARLVNDFKVCLTVPFSFGDTLLPRCCREHWGAFPSHRIVGVTRTSFPTWL